MKRWLALLLLCLLPLDINGCASCISGCAQVARKEPIVDDKTSRRQPIYKRQVYEQAPGSQTASPGEATRREPISRSEPVSIQERNRQRQALKRHFDASIGRLDYDGALLLLGKPSSLTHGDRLFIATWRVEHGKTVFEVDGVRVPIQPGEELQLIFNKGSRKLMSWRYNYQ